MTEPSIGYRLGSEVIQVSNTGYRLDDQADTWTDTETSMLFFSVKYK